MKKYFRTQSQLLLFSALLLTSIFGCIMILFRLYVLDFKWSSIDSFHDLKAYRGADTTFLFFVWNLFLAWMPYGIAMLLNRLDRASRPLSWIIASGCMLLWLIFFPNAPYIATDLLHLKPRPPIPFWYDVMMMFTFAWTGCMLGYASLFEIQYFLEKRFSQTITWLLVIISIVLGGFGVFMGRFQRWNSWDLATRPFALIRAQLAILADPFAYSNTLGVALVISVFMLLGYLTMYALRLKH